MDLHRLELLHDLSRLGSMTAVAQLRHTSTSTISQQLATLAREAGQPLLEPDGRRVRLTPAGVRLADHADRILAEVEAARTDLDPAAEPAGRLRVGGFATAIRTSLLPVVAALGESHPRVEVVVSQYEPTEAFDRLHADELDLALAYDYTLAPLRIEAPLESVPLWTMPWGLGVPADEPVPRRLALERYAGRPWVVNSRGTADDEAARTLASLAGFTPRITHRIDSLGLVEDLIVASRGVGLLPLHRPTRAAVRVLPLPEPGVTLRAYAVTRRGRAGWAPLRLLLDALVTRARAEPVAPWPA